MAAQVCFFAPPQAFASYRFRLLARLVVFADPIGFLAVFLLDAAAMAVTAPNYVLEESLSSQRLWKDTAGQRPPQPVEERAFFEKMWAQNFARSQVEYKMPVEVLTATTPISLNPFADGNFDVEGSAGNQLSNYNLAVPASSTITSETKKKQHPSDMAEAALMRKMYEPSRILHTPGAAGDLHYNAEVVNRPVKTTTSDGDTLTVLVKGDNVFGTTVSKSFARPSENGGPIKGVDTVNISVASYRVVEVSNAARRTMRTPLPGTSGVGLLTARTHPNLSTFCSFSPRNMASMLNF